MSDKFKAMFDEAREAGLPDEWVSRFESTFEASPLREENKATKERMREIADQNQKYRDTILAAQFRDHGVTISPTALRIPDDLDPTDAEKVEGWLVQSGLAQSKPTTDPSERATHDRIAQASNEGGQPVFDPQSLLNITDEEEFWTKAKQYEATRKR